MRTYLAPMAAAVLLLGGCAQTSSTYTVSEVGQPVETTNGTVVASRLVRVQGERNLVGAGAGAAAGAAGTTLAGGSGSAAVLGGLVGAGLGYLAQGGLTRREGIEYVVDLEDGRTVTIVQNRASQELPIESGAPVLVQLGSTYSRVLRDPRPADARRSGSGSPGDVWVNPDEVGSGGSYGASGSSDPSPYYAPPSGQQ
jgi:outer membrane lipoprotein SlyB